MYNIITLGTKNSADDILFFSCFAKKVGFGISYCFKICMTSLSLFSGENKESNINLSSAEPALCLLMGNIL